jgi:hypothetical protein
LFFQDGELGAVKLAATEEATVVDTRAVTEADTVEDTDMEMVR